MGKKDYIYGLLQIAITFIVGWLIESVASGKLLFMETVFSQKWNEKILGNSFLIILFLGALNIIVFVLSHKSEEKDREKNFYENICSSVFDEFIKSNSNLDNSLFRISLFKTTEKYFWLKENYYLPKRMICLKNVGRAQTRQKRELCKIKFLPDEGTVGLCYTISTVIFSKVRKYDDAHKNEYYQDHLDKTGLPINKAKKLQHKSASFMGCPVKFYKSDVLFGVLVLDCDDPDLLENTPQLRIIEKTLLSYSVFFTKQD